MQLLQATARPAPRAEEVRLPPKVPRCALRQRVFLSYHHGWDHARADLIRALAPDRISQALPEAEWDLLMQTGDAAVAQWISAQIAAASCTVVLISGSTRGRRLIEHEVLTSWRQRKGILGLYVHNLPDQTGARTHRGPNPFSEFRMTRDNQRLSDIVPVYEAPYPDLAGNLRYISAMLPEWVQEANSIRRNYSH